MILECIAPPVVRDAWKQVADRHAARFVAVDTFVSDTEVHRQRLEHREESGHGGWRRIEWSEVEATVDWLGPPAADAVVADAVNSVDNNVELVVAALQA